MHSPYSPHATRSRSPPLVPLPPASDHHHLATSTSPYHQDSRHLQDAAYTTPVYHQSYPAAETYDPRLIADQSQYRPAPPYPSHHNHHPYSQHHQYPQPYSTDYTTTPGADRVMRTSPATTPYAAPPSGPASEPYAAAAAANGGYPPAPPAHPHSAYFGSHHHHHHQQQHYPASDYYPAPPSRSPYDPAASTSAYPPADPHTHRRRRLSPSSSSGGGGPSPNLDYEAARREREREDIEREVGRREIEERERIKMEAAWNKERKKRYRAAAGREPSSPEYHRRSFDAEYGYEAVDEEGFNQLEEDEGEEDGEEEEEEEEQQDLDDLLRAVRGDLTPQKQQPQQQIPAPPEASASASGSSSKPLPWQEQQQPEPQTLQATEDAAPSREDVSASKAWSRSKSPRRTSRTSSGSATLRQSLEQQQRGDPSDDADADAEEYASLYDPPDLKKPQAVLLATATDTAAEEAESPSSSSSSSSSPRPRKRVRLSANPAVLPTAAAGDSIAPVLSSSRSPPKETAAAAAAAAAAPQQEQHPTLHHRLCLLPRKSVADYARRHELPMDAEARLVDEEEVLGEYGEETLDAEGGTGWEGRWSLFGETLHPLSPSTQILMARAMRDITYPTRLRLYDHPEVMQELERAVPWFVALLKTIKDRYELAGASSIVPQDPPPPPVVATSPERDLAMAAERLSNE
ncbi:hypothetical protein JCM10908_004381 [Rhodotorula pacifica]|uniref:uncharacterized protein n=1 Tax=Rhodotorula pacifica TaxID=1495444 RepID=UPI003175D5B6